MVPQWCYYVASQKLTGLETVGSLTHNQQLVKLKIQIAGLNGGLKEWEPSDISGPG